MISVRNESIVRDDDRQNQSPVRRQQARYPMRRNVLVHCRDLFHTAVLHDLSQGGCRLHGTFGLMPGDRIDIELMSGRIFSGRVAWSVGSQVGVALEHASCHDEAPAVFSHHADRTAAWPE